MKHFELVDKETPVTSANALVEYNEIVRTGADPADETAPWYFTRVNGALQLLTGLDVTKPPTDLPTFLTASPFHTKSHCIIIGERTTAADTWTHCPVDPQELFTPIEATLASWTVVKQSKATDPTQHVTSRTNRKTMY